MRGQYLGFAGRGVSLSALALSLCGPAFAQSVTASAASGQTDAVAADAPADEVAKADKAIIVTGTRIARSGFSAPTPITVMSAEMLERQGQVNVADFLNQIPAARSSGTTSTQTLTFRAGAGGNFINLRGLGPVRTLVLMDGQRIVPTTTTGLVDLNIVPTIMIERTEVVTGGASAAYGSDAVSGVVNLILKKNFTGLRLDAQTGISAYGDNKTVNLGAIAGFDFGSGGHVVVGADYASNSGVGSINERDWSGRQGGIVVGAGGVRYLVQDLQTNNQTFGGIINAGPLRGTAFADNGGAPYAFQYGNVFGNPNSTVQQGGTNPSSFNFNPSNLNVPFSRYTALVQAEYKFSPAFQLSASFNYANTGGSRPTLWARDTNISVRRDNAFLPTSVRNAMVSNNLQTVTVGRINRDIASFIYSDDNDLYRASIALKGDLGGSWGYDAYYSYGRNEAAYDYTARIDGAMPGDPAGTRRFLNAADAVRNANGEIVCRVNLTTVTTPGCVPFNIFGEQTLTEAQHNWLTGTQHVEQTTVQSAFGANLRGEPFSTWAGPVSFAVGGEYRKLTQDVVVDEGSIARAFHLGNTQPADGSFTVYEGYGEVLVPLLKDVPLFQTLDFNGALRRTHYSLSGSVTTWKGGVNWQLSDDLRFRLTRSRDIRAPNLAELFQPLTTSVNLANFPTGPAQLVTTRSAGNPDLKPEVANTLSLGAILTPRALPGFRASFDYFDIKLDGAITSRTGQQIVTGCLVNQVAEYCSRFTNNNTVVDISNVNLTQLRTSGFDFEMAYGFGIGSGRLDISTYATYVTRLTTTDPLGSFNRAGQIGGGIINPGSDTPHVTANANINYNRKALNLLANIRMVGGGVFDKFAMPGQIVGETSVPAIFYLNLSFDFTVAETGSRKFVLFGGMDNVLDRDPPRALTQQQFFASGAGAYYDVVGRRFRMGARVQF